MKAFVYWGVGLLLSTSGAQAYCYEPSVPSCANDYGPFDSRWEFDSCRSEIESFQRDIEDYAQCLSREIDDLVEEARRKISTKNDELSEAIDDFNSRASQ